MAYTKLHISDLDSLHQINLGDYNISCTHLELILLKLVNGSKFLFHWYLVSFLVCKSSDNSRNMFNSNIDLDCSEVVKSEQVLTYVDEWL